MSPAIGFVTSTYRRDLRRFRLLRASLDRFAPTVDHWVAVQTEDVELFRRSVPASPRLHLVATADLLSPRLEKLRLRSNFFHRTKWLWSFSKRALPQGAFDGYHSQQLAKLELVRRAPVEHLLVIDSDVVMLRPTNAAVLLPEISGGGEQPASRRRKPIQPPLHCRGGATRANFWGCSLGLLASRCTTTSPGRCRWRAAWLPR